MHSIYSALSFALSVHNTKTCCAYAILTSMDFRRGCANTSQEILFQRVEAVRRIHISLFFLIFDTLVYMPVSGAEIQLTLRYLYSISSLLL